MRAIRVVLVSLALALLLAMVSSAPASAVICHDHPGGCCEDVEILGKTILHIDC